MLLNTLYDDKKLNVDKWVITNCQYGTRFGSFAYGVSNESSDIDIIGFTIPPKEVIFPHTTGIIRDFGYQGKRFDQYQEHHIKYDDSKEYDITIYSIIKYFQLCMGNNPNMIDSLFVPDRCIFHITNIGQMVRDKRKIFLHAGAWQKFKGYSYSQKNKMENKNPTGKRKETVDKYGYDTKFAYHLVRLMNEIEQILIEGDLDLERNREQLKSIRRGEWTKEQIIKYFEDKEKLLEEAYAKTKLPWGPDEPEIKELLLNCLEHHYGSLDKVIKKSDRSTDLINELEQLIERYK